MRRKIKGRLLLRQKVLIGIVFKSLKIVSSRKQKKKNPESKSETIKIEQTDMSRSFGEIC